MESSPHVKRLLLIHDWETTGLTLHPDAPLSLQPKAIEFGSALMDCETGEVVERCSFLINPGETITQEITNITGITNADVEGGLPFQAYLSNLTKIYGRAAAMLSHNLPFDKSILLCELARLGMKESDFPFPKIELCTVGLHREQWGGNMKLKSLYEAVLGKPLAQTHRAQDDVDALVEIVQAAEIWRLV